MPFLNQLVCKINNSLSTTSLTAGLIDGIAYQVTRKTEQGDQLFPAIFDGGLVEKYIGIDDSNSTIVYHRHLRNAYRKNPQIENRYTQTVQMVMVVYGNKNLLQVQTPDALESLIIKSFPTRFEPAQLTGLPGLDDVNISVTGSEMNPATVFASEYRNVPYRLSPDEIYFSISYTLEIQFDNNCLDECNPNPPDSLCDFIELASAEQILACMTADQESDMQELICTESTAVELYFAFEAGTDTSVLATNSGTTWTLTAISDDGSSGTITVSDNGGAYGAFVNPTTIANAETIQVKRTTTTGAGWVLLTGTYA